MTRYCPKCGEPVPTNCLTCPKCYTKMPPEAPKQRESDPTNGDTKKDKSSSTRLLLTVIPAFFGLLGIGQIYRDPKDRKGYFFLFVGLLFFVTGNALLLSMIPGLAIGVLKTVVGVSLLFIYFLMFLLSLFDSLMNVNVKVRI